MEIVKKIELKVVCKSRYSEQVVSLKFLIDQFVLFIGKKCKFGWVPFVWYYSKVAGYDSLPLLLVHTRVYYILGICSVNEKSGNTFLITYVVQFEGGKAKVLKIPTVRSILSWILRKFHLKIPKTAAF